MRTFISSILATAAAVVAVLTLAVLPASAKTARPNVFIDDEHGVLTTPCVVYPGETLHGIGYVAGTFTITSVHADGPVFLVTLSPAPVPPQSSEVLDFIS